MTGNALDRLPRTADPRSWTPQQLALMQFANVAKVVNGNVIVPNPGVAEAFLVVCQRTGLDPLAKQIYMMEVSGKPLIVVGVDGFRVVAQRSKGYRGQVGPQWSTGRLVDVPMVIDGHAIVANGSVVMRKELEWIDAWIPEVYGLDKDAKPFAARIGILREGFSEPLWQVATWKEFGVAKRFNGDNWDVRPAHMLGIRVETHGLRRAFPNDLSGLYTAEDFDGVDQVDDIDAVKTDIGHIEAITDLDELKRLFHEKNSVGMPEAVRVAIMARAGVLGAVPPAAAHPETGPGTTEPTSVRDVTPSGTENPSEDPQARKSARTPARVVVPEPEETEEERFDRESAAEHDAMIAAQEAESTRA